uniref:RNA-dependent RNA polymerase n=1 Tax=Lentinula edodes ourmia-like virus 1 TaxID=2992854 RepID=A0A9E7V869_9VIRU|nr:RNA-dependent RNA polymerase [Lentinula edodes ourmia-like virus 1]
MAVDARQTVINMPLLGNEENAFAHSHEPEVIERNARINAAIEAVDRNIRKAAADKGLLDQEDDRAYAWFESRRSDLPSLVSDASQIALIWENVVKVLGMARRRKEFLLTIKPPPVDTLDHLDAVELDACGVLYTSFRRILGESNVTFSHFSKKTVDAEMEDRFGSINQPGGDVTLEEARCLFSRYLCRKVWVAHEWRKLGESLGGFQERVCYTPIEKPVSEKAKSIALQVLRVVMLLAGSTEEFRKVEHSPSSACLEKPRCEGGKRLCQFVDKRRAPPKHVKPVPIYSSGKIRVVTIDSVDHVKYTWINKWLASGFKKLPCSVFGREVDEWWNDVKEVMTGMEGMYVSGDLDSATDFFDGRLTNALIDELACLDGISEHDIRELKAFTTEAQLQFGSGRKKFLIRQTRGQLMGSVISFPLLCILNLTAYLYTKPDKWLHRFLNPKKAGGKASVRMLQKLREVGVNGDDVAFKGNGLTIAKWLEGVDAIGGIVSRGKTLVNEKFFTINSMLRSDEGHVSVLRASLVTAMTDADRQVSAERSWKEYLSLPNSDNVEQVFEVSRRMKVGLPVQLGGTGLRKKMNIEELLDGWVDREYRRQQESAFLYTEKWKLEDSSRREMLETGFDERSSDESVSGLFTDRRTDEVWLTKEMAKSYSKIYSTQYSHFAVPRPIHRMLLCMLRDHWEDKPALQPFLPELLRVPTFFTRQEIVRDVETTRAQLVGQLIEDYEPMMNGYRLKRVPKRLAYVLQAFQRTRFVAGVDHVKVDPSHPFYTIPSENWNPYRYNAEYRRLVRDVRCQNKLVLAFSRTMDLIEGRK